MQSTAFTAAHEGRQCRGNCQEGAHSPRVVWYNSAAATSVKGAAATPVEDATATPVDGVKS